MNNNRRRNFRARSQKNNFRRRTGSSSSINNGNMNFNRNGSMNNIHNVEKTISYQQLADAQSNETQFQLKLFTTRRSLFEKI